MSHVYSKQLIKALSDDDGELTPVEDMDELEDLPGTNRDPACLVSLSSSKIGAKFPTTQVPAVLLLYRKQKTGKVQELV